MGALSVVVVGACNHHITLQEIPADQIETTLFLVVLLKRACFTRSRADIVGLQR
ncbi:MAG TPA: hypothetical protein VGL17_11935 [Gemmatimonadaceae bacterium]|jgi:hypothetical protein